jgi:ferric-dicitrate binding protein FerR (iron transport regulator)
MNDVRKEEWIRLSMQRELTAEEEANLESWLAAHPETRAQWEDERALSRAVRALPDVPVSSNFTSRVLQAVRTDQLGDTRKRTSRLRWFGWSLPRLGWALALLVVVSFVIFERATKPKDFSKSVVMLPVDFAKLPSPDVLADFDAINQLRQASASGDDELLKALQ